MSELGPSAAERLDAVGVARAQQRHGTAGVLHTFRPPPRPTNGGDSASVIAGAPMRAGARFHQCPAQIHLAHTMFLLCVRRL